MTWLQALIVKVLMLAVTVGVLYWAAVPEDVSNPEPSPPVLQRADATRGEESEAPTAAPVPRRPVKFPLDLNNAKAEELMELPGIGEKLAQRLVEYRRSHGGFRSVEDLRKVRGIGEKRMKRLRPLVRTAEAP